MARPKAMAALGTVITLVMVVVGKTASLQDMYPNEPPENRSSVLLNPHQGLDVKPMQSAVPNIGMVNDEDIGEDWLQSKDVEQHSREKRAMGTSLEDVVVEMDRIAMQTVGPDTLTAIDYGDSFTYQATVDLPGILPGDKADLAIEIFGLEPDAGIAAFHICQAHMVSRGDNVQSIQVAPYFAETKKANYPNVIETSRLLFQQTYTTAEDNADLNKVVVQFQAILVPTGDVEDKDYYITAGAEYGNEQYVWVGQEKVTVSRQSRTYPANIELVTPPTHIKKGSAELFTVNAYVTDPATDFEFGVFQPLGYNDLFHIGKINKQVGNAFACSDPSFWTERKLQSPSGLTTVNSSIFYPFLINREAARDENNESNLIELKIPIHVLNIDTVEVGAVRNIAFGLKIGDTKLWTALHEITIDASVASGTAQAPFNITVLGHNNLTSVEGISPGNAMIFVASVHLEPGWNKFDILLRGDSNKEIYPIGAKIVDSGHVGYFPPDWTVTTIVGIDLTASYDDVYNANDVETEVLVELSFATTKGTTVPGNHTVTGSIGGESLDDLEIPVIENPSPDTITVVANEFGWADELYKYGQAGLDLLVTVPPSAGDEELLLEAVPDFDVTDTSVRLCRIRVTKIGEGLPCLFHANLRSKEVYSKSSEMRPFNDFGEIHMGRSCPTTYPNSDAGTNQFTAQLIYELPPQTTYADDDPYKINAGLKIGDSTIWVSTREYLLKTDDYSSVGVANSTYGPKTPYVTSYPIMSERDNGVNGEFDRDSGFYVKYIIKTHPQTRGDYTFKIVPPSDVLVCKVIITFIGDNMPCTEPPGPSLTGYENTEIIYAEGDGNNAHMLGQEAKIVMKGVTNWGRDDIVPDLTPDDNSINIVAFFRVDKDATTAGSVDILHGLKTGTDTIITGNYNATLSGTLKAINNDAPTSVTYKSLTGNDDEIWKGICKMIEIKVVVPETFHGDLDLEVTNPDYLTAGKIVDFCGIVLVGVGDNLPCVRLQNDTEPVITNATGFEESADGELLKMGMHIKVEGVCHVKYSIAENANTLTFLAAVRVRDDRPVDDIVTLSIKAKTADLTTTEPTAQPSLTVKEANLTSDSLDVDDPKVMIDPANDPYIDVSVGEKIWIPFYIKFPINKRLKMEASVLLPSDSGVAIFHATDIKFGDSPGLNVPCTTPDVDLQRSFVTTFEQTANLTTFMQMDSVTVDLGYIENVGYTYKQGVHYTSDDQFSLKVEIQMADHIKTTNETTHEVFVAVQFGETIVVASQNVRVIRPPTDDRPDEEGMLVINVNQTTEQTEFNRDDTIEFEAVIHHDEASKAEGYPTKVRVITPSYVRWVDGSNSFYTNYSIPNTNQTIELMFNETGDHELIFNFPAGITFPDRIYLNFSMTVDPDRLRLPGAGNEDTAIVIHGTCEQNAIDGFPVSGEEERLCGDFISLEKTATAPECYLDLNGNLAEDQITASFMAGTAGTPGMAIGPTNNFWSPPIRIGRGWEHWLQFDFLAEIRITRVSYTLNAQSRVVEKVLIQSSNVPGYFSNLVESNSKTIDLSPATRARFTRIVFSKLLSADEETAYLKVSNVNWFGCVDDDYDDKKGTVTDYVTPSSEQAEYYRHFAVHKQDDIDIVYFCDLNPLIDGMLCYASDQNEAENTWNELPRYIGHILGYSPTMGRMYFKGRGDSAIFSSRDGKRVEITDTDPSADSDFQSAVVVPGDTADVIGDKAWTTAPEYKGTFDGLFKGTTKLVHWNTCCTAS